MWRLRKKEGIVISIENDIKRSDKLAIQTEVKKYFSVLHIVTRKLKIRWVSYIHFLSKIFFMIKWT